MLKSYYEKEINKILVGEYKLHEDGKEVLEKYKKHMEEKNKSFEKIEGLKRGLNSSYNYCFGKDILYNVKKYTKNLLKETQNFCSLNDEINNEEVSIYDNILVKIILEDTKKELIVKNKEIEDCFILNKEKNDYKFIIFNCKNHSFIQEYDRYVDDFYEKNEDNQPKTLFEYAKEKNVIIEDIKELEGIYSESDFDEFRKKYTYFYQLKEGRFDDENNLVIRISDMFQGLVFTRCIKLNEKNVLIESENFYF